MPLPGALAFLLLTGGELTVRGKKRREAHTPFTLPTPVLVLV
jgi:hypothetical protein